MKTFIAITVAYVLSQTCPIPAPATPPVPTQLVVILPVDGGTQGCTIQAFVPGSKFPANVYTIGNAKCAQAVAMATNAAAIDNGWADGGTP